MNRRRRLKRIQEELKKTRNDEEINKLDQPLERAQAQRCFNVSRAYGAFQDSYSYNEEELSIVEPHTSEQAKFHITTAHMFEAVAWANIFKESNVTDILVSLLNQVKKSKVQDGSSSDEDLKLKLLMEFTGRRYLVVLDGVQTRDQWLCLKHAFPEQQNGSKIILTTCDKQVAEYDDQKWQPYYLKKLGC